MFIYKWPINSPRTRILEDRIGLLISCIVAATSLQLMAAADLFELLQSGHDRDCRRGRAPSSCTQRGDKSRPTCLDSSWPRRLSTLSDCLLSFVKANAHASCARSFLRMSIVICSHTGEWWGARHIDGRPLRLFLLALSSGSGGDWGIGHLSFPSHEDDRLLAIA